MFKRGTIVVFLLLSSFYSSAQSDVSKAAHRFWNSTCRPVVAFANDFLQNHSNQNQESFYVIKSPYTKTLFIDAKSYLQLYDINMPTTGLEEYLPEEMGNLYPSNWTDLMFANARIKSHKTSADIGLTWGNLSMTLPIPINNDFTKNYGLASYGSAFGFAIRYRRQKNTDGSKVNGIQQMRDSVYFRLMKWQMSPESGMDQSPVEPVRETIKSGDMRLNTFYVDAYYVFNHRRFCLSAVRTGMNIQRHSAGSVFAMANYNLSNLRMDDLMNAEHDYFRHSQASLGLGYGYNLSILGGKACAQATVIPMFSIANRATHKAYNIGFTGLNSPIENRGSEWYDFDKNFYNSIDNDGSSLFTINGFSRLGVIYNIDRFFLCANCEYRRFIFRNSASCKINNSQLDMTFRLGWRW